MNRKSIAATVLVMSACLGMSASAWAADLEHDVMKPMGRALAYVSKNKADPTKATEVLTQATNIVSFVELGLTLEPATQPYVSLQGEVGAEDARRKFTGLMEVLRVSALQLKKRAQSVAPGSACGDSCGLIVDEMRSIEELGHGIFVP